MAVSKVELSYGRSLVVAVVVAFVMLWATPLVAPSSDLLTYATARAQSRLMGGYYPAARHDDVTVLLIDDDSVERVGRGWPVPYGSHARWLSNLGSLYQPRAIFLDITFGQERQDDTLPALRRALCRLRDAGVPVFLAALAGEDGQLHLRPGLETPPGEPPCFTMVDVRYRASKVDRMVWSYPLWTEPGVRSAALAVAQDAAGIRFPPNQDTMALTWGVDNVDQSRYAEWCRQSRGGFIELLPGALRGLILGEKNPSLPICPYSHVLTMSELLNAAPEDEERLQRMLHGRYVMIGAAISGYNDVILSPVHEMIPGVFMHAMALDNLLTYGKNYKRALDWSIWPPNALWLLGLPVVMLAHFLHWAIQTSRARYHWCEKLFTPLSQWHQIPRPERRPAALRGRAYRHWHRQVVLARRRARAILKRPARLVVFKVAAAFDFVIRKVLEILISGSIVLGIVLLAQTFFNIGTLPVVDLATMALAAQWLGWTNKFTAFLFRKPRVIAEDVLGEHRVRRLFRKRQLPKFTLKRRRAATSPEVSSGTSSS